MMGAPHHGANGRRLSRDRVLRAALDLVDAEGLPTLTMRRLAAELDVGVMSLYRYIETKRDLLDGITELALESLSVPPPEEGTWDEQLTAAAHRIYAAMREHPGATQILADGFIPGPALDPLREWLLRILHVAGFDNQQAASYLQTLFTYTLGFVVLAGHSEAPFVEEWHRISALPSDSFPYLAQSAAEFSRRFTTPSFEAGLAVIIKGLQAELSVAH
ncbi:MAG: tetracycline repressor [Mycobacterium sp.]|jgi:AcrR family transcriptional regulator|nr:tetracycline repressor [Mycobacterium sp.]